MPIKDSSGAPYSGNAVSKHRSKYHFSEIWFEKNIPIWTDQLKHLCSYKLEVLEIGSFEGASTTWILDELFKNENSILTSVDTFEGSVEHKSSKEISSILGSIEEKFDENINKTGKSDQLKKIKSKSYDALIEMNLRFDVAFDLIYIDGSHVASDVISDAVLSWPLLKEGGILIFDDYKWDKYSDDYNNPRIAIDAFINCYKPELEIIRIGYQVIVKKIIRSRIYKGIE